MTEIGFPNATGLSYVRVATGGWSQEGNQRESQFVEGFLIREDAESFTVFLCSVAKSEDRFFDYHSPLAPLRTFRFVRKTTGPVYEQVRYEIQDLRQVASEFLARVREPAASSERAPDYSPLVWQRARIFSFARAALQQGHSDIAYPLMEIAAALPDPQDDRIVRPGRLRDYLQEQIGEAVLTQAELDAGNPDVPWTALLKTYDEFGKRFPANSEIAYARANASVLKRMIAEEAKHNPKALDQLTPGEQVAENIYQLRNIRYYPWSHGDTINPVHRLIDLGYASVPQLIEALDDHSFTRALPAIFNGAFRRVALRVNDFAERILEVIAGRNFSIMVDSDGKPLRTTVRQRAEAWWTEVQRKGERQQLIDDAAAGGNRGLDAARALLERYPDATIAAVEIGLRATSEPYWCGDYVNIAARVPGDAPVPFLRLQLAGQSGLYAQVQAARGLLARGQLDAVPSIINAWRDILPRLQSVGLNNQAPFDEAGVLMGFLATSGDVRAIDALGEPMPQVAVDVRLAVVQAFLPSPRHGGLGGTGRTVRAVIDREAPPSTDVAAAIERLLRGALADKDVRVGLEGTHDEVGFTDPRVADMAALALATRWPAKYSFTWPASIAERDAQIARIRIGGE